MRQYYTYPNEDVPVVEGLLAMLADKNTDVAAYQYAFYGIGKALGEVLRENLTNGYKDNTLLACASEDADWLAKGVLEGIDCSSLPVAVFWTKRYSLSSGVDIAPITMSYQDNTKEKCRNLIIVKSIISSSCVVKTQLLRLISTLDPEKIFILAPVMLKGAQKNLEKEFPKEIVDRFSYFLFAEDDEIEGKEIIPGIGGMVYDRLGLNGEAHKNEYIPKLVMERL